MAPEHETYEEWQDRTAPAPEPVTRGDFLRGAAWVVAGCALFLPDLPGDLPFLLIGLSGAITLVVRGAILGTRAEVHDRVPVVIWWAFTGACVVWALIADPPGLRSWLVLAGLAAVEVALLVHRRRAARD